MMLCDVDESKFKQFSALERIRHVKAQQFHPLVRIHPLLHHTKGRSHDFDITNHSKYLEWKLTRNGAESSVSENNKTELRLGLPGGEGEESNSSSSSLNINHESAFQREAHKLELVPYLQHFLMTQKLELVSEEPSKACSLRTAEFPYLNGQSCPKTGSVPADSSQEPKHHHKRASVASAVGWPPIRSSRKNYVVPRSSKPNPHELSKEAVKEGNASKSDCCSGQMFVKVCMDGVPIGRKLNLQAYNSYDQLSAAIHELFHCLLAAQKGYLAAEDQRKMEETASLSDSKHINGMYTLVYYDNEGDRMLVGDVPWNMFVSTVKRLHVLKSSAIATEKK
ncbi:auxin-responsive protein IAA16-like isoform X4 [Cucurbita pepo subsp. pepo]|uniref:auxin-responsive protein IAA16-like isoform X4 n=1 Tax=Cucurbita pepo subsp. pepo TaxID=3664 RepID=UPI000C9D323A|nr:auxin-responsive protein IAA16-like isoform X4 [Cucurbita pepo subsp. pepo]